MNRRTSYTYDSMGNVTSVTDAKLQVTKYTYDLENNLTGRTTPMGRTEEYVRDVAGRLTQRITPSGNAIHYDYDTLNSLVENEIAQVLGEGWTADSYGKSGTGWKFINDEHPDLMVFYHNADGVHGGAYYGFSAGPIGTVKLVGPDYMPLPGDKAIIIQMK